MYIPSQHFYSKEAPTPVQKRAIRVQTMGPNENSGMRRPDAEPLEDDPGEPLAVLLPSPLPPMVGVVDGAPEPGVAVAVLAPPAF